MSRESLRDQSVERLLKESFRTSARMSQPGSCLDVETLAAWIDGSLAGGQLTAASEHLADCVDCQATLAAFARTTSPEAVPEPWWRRGLSARWLVPVAAAATVIAIWIAVPRDEYTRQPEQTTTAVEQVATPQTKSTGELTARADRPSPAGADERLPEQPAPELRREAAAEGAAPARRKRGTAGQCLSRRGQRGSSAAGGRSRCHVRRKGAARHDSRGCHSGPAADRDRLARRLDPLAYWPLGRRGVLRGRRRDVGIDAHRSGSGPDGWRITVQDSVLGRRTRGNRAADDRRQAVAAPDVPRWRWTSPQFRQPMRAPPP